MPTRPATTAPAMGASIAAKAPSAAKSSAPAGIIVLSQPFSLKCDGPAAPGHILERRSARHTHRQEMNGGLRAAALERKQRAAPPVPPVFDGRKEAMTI